MQEIPEGTATATCGACQRVIPTDSRMCPYCGRTAGTPPTSPVALQALPTDPQGDATGGVIPYKNPPALVAYYCGVFSVIPFFPIGLAALFLGIAGLRRRTRHPEVKGAVHAWIGILIGGFFGLLWTALTGLVIYKGLSA